MNPERLLSGFGWSDTIWRQGELAAQFKGKTVLLGVDDMDVFKGIELKLQVGGAGDCGWGQRELIEGGQLGRAMIWTFSRASKSSCRWAVESRLTVC